MIFTDFFAGWNFIMAIVLLISLALGFVAHRTNFCTMGAISDYANFGNKSRLRSWVLAMATAIFSIAILEHMGIVNVTDSFPGYRSEQFIWLENIIGGILFGVGMTFAGGCGNKTLVRLGEGNMNSLIVAIAISVVAYYMINPLPGTDVTIYSYAFYDWIRPLSVDLIHPQDIGAFVSHYTSSLFNATIEDIRFIAAMLISFIAFTWVFKVKNKAHNIVAGFLIGTFVVGFWAVSSVVKIDLEGEPSTMVSYMEEWDMAYEQPESEPEVDDINTLKPNNTNSFRPQSYTFVSPIGGTYGFIKDISSADSDSDNQSLIMSTRPLLSMGLMAVIGVIIGSFFSSIASKQFSLEFKRSPRVITSNLISGMTMGVGGVLSLGCTIGQGITGVSTLAIGSFVTLFAIIIGSFATQKFMYWKLMRDV